MNLCAMFLANVSKPYNTAADVPALFFPFGYLNPEWMLQMYLEFHSLLAVYRFVLNREKQSHIQVSRTLFQWHFSHVKL